MWLVVLVWKSPVQFWAWPLGNSKNYFFIYVVFFGAYVLILIHSEKESKQSRGKSRLRTNFLLLNSIVFYSLPLQSEWDISEWKQSGTDTKNNMLEKIHVFFKAKTFNVQTCFVIVIKVDCRDSSLNQRTEWNF